MQLRPLHIDLFLRRGKRRVVFIVQIHRRCVGQFVAAYCLSGYPGREYDLYGSHRRYIHVRPGEYRSFSIVEGRACRSAVDDQRLAAIRVVHQTIRQCIRDCRYRARIQMARALDGVRDQIADLYAVLGRCFIRRLARIHRRIAAQRIDERFLRHLIRCHGGFIHRNRERITVDERNGQVVFIVCRRARFLHGIYICCTRVRIGRRQILKYARPAVCLRELDAGKSSSSIVVAPQFDSHRRRKLLDLCLSRNLLVAKLPDLPDRHLALLIFQIVRIRIIEHALVGNRYLLFRRTGRYRLLTRLLPGSVRRLGYRNHRAVRDIRQRRVLHGLAVKRICLLARARAVRYVHRSGHRAGRIGVAVRDRKRSRDVFHIRSVPIDYLFDRDRARIIRRTLELVDDGSAVCKRKRLFLRIPAYFKRIRGARTLVIAVLVMRRLLDRVRLTILRHVERNRLVILIQAHLRDLRCSREQAERRLDSSADAIRRRAVSCAVGLLPQLLNRHRTCVRHVRRRERYARRVLLHVSGRRRRNRHRVVKDIARILRFGNAVLACRQRDGRTIAAHHTVHRHRLAVLQPADGERMIRHRSRLRGARYAILQNPVAYHAAVHVRRHRHGEVKRICLHLIRHAAASVVDRLGDAQASIVAAAHAVARVGKLRLEHIGRSLAGRQRLSVRFRIERIALCAIGQRFLRTVRICRSARIHSRQLRPFYLRLAGRNRLCAYRLPRLAVRTALQRDRYIRHRDVADRCPRLADPRGDIPVVGYRHLDRARADRYFLSAVYSRPIVRRVFGNRNLRIQRHENLLARNGIRICRRFARGKRRRKLCTLFAVATRPRRRDFKALIRAQRLAVEIHSLGDLQHAYRRCVGDFGRASHHLRGKLAVIRDKVKVCRRVCFGNAVVHDLAARKRGFLHDIVRADRNVRKYPFVLVPGSGRLGRRRFILCAGIFAVVESKLRRRKLIELNPIELPLLGYFNARRLNRVGDCEVPVVDAYMIGEAVVERFLALIIHVDFFYRVGILHAICRVLLRQIRKRVRPYSVSVRLARVRRLRKRHRRAIIDAILLELYLRRRRYLHGAVLERRAVELPRLGDRQLAIAVVQLRRILHGKYVSGRLGFLCLIRIRIEVLLFIRFTVFRYAVLTGRDNRGDDRRLARLDADDPEPSVRDRRLGLAALANPVLNRAARYIVRHGHDEVELIRRRLARIGIGVVNLLGERQRLRRNHVARIGDIQAALRLRITAQLRYFLHGIHDLALAGYSSVLRSDIHIPGQSRELRRPRFDLAILIRRSIQRDHLVRYRRLRVLNSRITVKLQRDRRIAHRNARVVRPRLRRRYCLVVSFYERIGNRQGIIACRILGQCFRVLIVSRAFSRSVISIRIAILIVRRYRTQTGLPAIRGIQLDVPAPGRIFSSVHLALHGHDNSRLRRVCRRNPRLRHLQVGRRLALVGNRYLLFRRTGRYRLLTRLLPGSVRRLGYRNHRAVRDIRQRRVLHGLAVKRICLLARARAVRYVHRSGHRAGRIGVAVRDRKRSRDVFHIRSVPIDYLFDRDRARIIRRTLELVDDGSAVCKRKRLFLRIPAYFKRIRGARTLVIAVLVMRRLLDRVRLTILRHVERNRLVILIQAHLRDLRCSREQAERRLDSSADAIRRRAVSCAVGLLPQLLNRHRTCVRHVRRRERYARRVLLHVSGRRRRNRHRVVKDIARILRFGNAVLACRQRDGRTIAAHHTVHRHRLAVLQPADGERMIRHRSRLRGARYAILQNPVAYHAAVHVRRHRHGEVKRICLHLIRHAAASVVDRLGDAQASIVAAAHAVARVGKLRLEHIGRSLAGRQRLSVRFRIERIALCAIGQRFLRTVRICRSARIHSRQLRPFYLRLAGRNRLCAYRLPRLAVRTALQRDRYIRHRDVADRCPRLADPRGDIPVVGYRHLDRARADRYFLSAVYSRPIVRRVFGNRNLRIQRHENLLARNGIRICRRFARGKRRRKLCTLFAVATRPRRRDFKALIRAQRLAVEIHSLGDLQHAYRRCVGDFGRASHHLRGKLAVIRDKVKVCRRVCFGNAVVHDLAARKRGFLHDIVRADRNVRKYPFVLVPGSGRLGRRRFILCAGIFAVVESKLRRRKLIELNPIELPLLGYFNARRLNRVGDCEVPVVDAYMIGEAVVERFLALIIHVDFFYRVGILHAICRVLLRQIRKRVRPYSVSVRLARVRRLRKRHRRAIIDAILLELYLRRRRYLHGAVLERRAVELPRLGDRQLAIAVVQLRRILHGKYVSGRLGFLCLIRIRIEVLLFIRFTVFRYAVLTGRDNRGDDRRLARLDADDPEPSVRDRRLGLAALANPVLNRAARYIVRHGHDEVELIRRRLARIGIGVVNLLGERQRLRRNHVARIGDIQAALRLRITAQLRYFLHGIHDLALAGYSSVLRSDIHIPGQSRELRRPRFDLAILIRRSIQRDHLVRYRRLRVLNSRITVKLQRDRRIAHRNARVVRPRLRRRYCLVVSFYERIGNRQGIIACRILGQCFRVLIVSRAFSRSVISIRIAILIVRRHRTQTGLPAVLGIQRDFFAPRTIYRFAHTALHGHDNSRLRRVCRRDPCLRHLQVGRRLALVGHRNGAVRGKRSVVVIAVRYRPRIVFGFLNLHGRAVRQRIGLAIVLTQAGRNHRVRSRGSIHIGIGIAAVDRERIVRLLVILARLIGNGLCNRHIHGLDGIYERSALGNGRRRGRIPGCRISAQLLDKGILIFRAVELILGQIRKRDRPVGRLIRRHGDIVSRDLLAVCGNAVPKLKH